MSAIHAVRRSQRLAVLAVVVAMVSLAACQGMPAGQGTPVDGSAEDYRATCQTPKGICQVRFNAPAPPATPCACASNGQQVDGKVK